MPLFWFMAGVLTTLASLIVISPWLRKMPSLSSLPAAPLTASVAAVAVVATVFGLHAWLGPSAAPAASQVSDKATGAFGTAAKVFSDATSGSGDAASAAAKPAASSMDSAIASLESRLAKGSGSADDWELLAKSFEFLGRPADAAKARARQLPALPTGGDAADAAAVMAPSASKVSGAAVSGEITLAPGLLSRAAAGETLFIVAKSVNAPGIPVAGSPVAGIPVAVFRGSVGAWPLKFTLDDSQSMLPGHNLSSAGRVTIEARISQNGQPLPASGDLQGSSGVINPADHRSLKILIDRVIK